MKRLLKLLLVFNILVVIAAILAFLAPQTHPSTSIIPSLMSLGFPIILVLNVLCLLIWTSLRNYYALLSLAVLVLGWKAITGFVNFSTAESKPESITVATLNLHRMIDMSPDWKPAASEVNELMTELGTPNILCLQEAGDISAYRDAIPYKHIIEFGTNQTALVTNYPVVNSKTIDMSPEQSYSGWTDLDINGNIIRVYSLYLASNRITVESERLFEEGTFQSKENIRDALGVLRRYVGRARIRANQVEAVKQSIAESPYPVIVCGDFNDVPLSYSTSQLTKDLQDSFVAKGFGIGATYAGKLPGLRIDYILADDHFRILSHNILKLNISDHYPVVVEVDFRE